VSVPGLFLVYLLVLCLAGPPFALSIGPADAFEYQAMRDATGDWQGYALSASNYLLRDNDVALVWTAYGWAAYAVGVLVALHLLLLRRDAQAYVERPADAIDPTHLRSCWLACMAGIGMCGIVLFVQGGFSHPLASSFHLGWPLMNAARVESAQRLSPVVYALGMQVFCAGAVVLAVHFVRDARTRIATAVAVAAFATFSLAKSPLGYLVVETLVVSLLLRRIVVRRGLALLAGVVVLMTGIVAFTLKSTNLPEVVEATLQRLLLGEFSDLPTYLRIFADDPVHPLSLLPAYVKGWLGVDAAPAGRLLQLATLNDQRMQVAGVANTLFVGEAFAVFGAAGAVLAPFVVFANAYIICRVFFALGKSFTNTFVFGYLLFKLLIGLFSGISVYLFSGIHIVLLAFLAARLVPWQRLRPLAERH
jgi:hypothetical protein